MTLCYKHDTCAEYNELDARIREAEFWQHHVEADRLIEQTYEFSPVCLSRPTQDSEAGNNNECATCGQDHITEHWSKT